jgi:hypothetical protein
LAGAEFIAGVSDVARPIVLGASRASRRGWQGILSVYWKQTFIPGDYTGDDFGQVPPPRGDEVLRSTQHA